MTNFEKIAEMLGVEFDKWFKIKQFKQEEFKITSNGLINNRGNYLPNVFCDLLQGIFEIDRWPQVGDNYYAPSFKTQSKFSLEVWNDSDYDYSIKKCVGVYRTKEEAQEKARELGWLDD